MSMLVPVPVSVSLWISVLSSPELMLDATSRLTCKGKRIYHSFYTSTFTEYTVVLEISVTKTDDAAPMDKVCLVTCEVTTGYVAGVHSANVRRYLCVSMCQ